MALALLSCLSLLLLLVHQVIAYNKIDLPDSGDYWEFVQEYLLVSFASHLAAIGVHVYFVYVVSILFI